MSCKIRVKIDAKILAALGDSPEEKAAEILCSVFGKDKKSRVPRKQKRQNLSASVLPNGNPQRK